MVVEGRQAFGGGTSRISREAYVRICERPGVKLPRPTRRSWFHETLGLYNGYRVFETAPLSTGEQSIQCNIASAFSIGTSVLIWP